MNRNQSLTYLETISCVGRSRGCLLLSVHEPLAASLHAPPHSLCCHLSLASRRPSHDPWHRRYAVWGTNQNFCSPYSLELEMAYDSVRKGFLELTHLSSLQHFKLIAPATNRDMKDIINRRNLIHEGRESAPENRQGINYRSR